MNEFTGRRNTGLGARVAKGFFAGLGAIGTAMADGPKLARIQEIDSELERLQHEKDSLIAGLIEPGDLKVSEDYDPSKSFAPVVTTGEGRLVHCEGRSTMSVYNDAHPGCPYLEKIHNEHDFTLRD